MSAWRRYAYRGGVLLVDNIEIAKDGKISVGKCFYTIYVKNDSCRRLNLEALPSRKTFKTAQRDLDKWAAARCLKEVDSDEL